MARRPRVVVPGLPHHVTLRGHRRQRTFFDDEDDAEYRRLLSASCRACGTQVLVYCLMPNHVHLILVPADELGLRDALGEAHRRDTRMINVREGWRGHLWQGRFHALVMDQRHLIAAARSVELNPVCAELRARPQDWPWSSARAHLAGADDELVGVRPLLELTSDWARFFASLAPRTSPTCYTRMPAPTVRSVPTHLSKLWSNASGALSSDKSRGLSHRDAALTPGTFLSCRNGIRSTVPGIEPELPELNCPRN
jgi:putative transposase